MVSISSDPAIESSNIHAHKNTTLCYQKVFFHSPMELCSHALHRILKETRRGQGKTEGQKRPSLTVVPQTRRTTGGNVTFGKLQTTAGMFQESTELKLWLSYSKGAHVVVFWKLSKAEKILPPGDILTIKNNQHFLAWGLEDQSFSKFSTELT